MTIRLITAIICFVFSCTLSFGQEREGFRITDLMVNLTEKDSVKTMFSIKVTSKEATRKGALLLTPMILNDSIRTLLPAIYVEKPKNWLARIFSGGKPAPDSLTTIKVGVAADYSAAIPFEEWMNGAKMNLEIVRVRKPHDKMAGKTLQNNLVLERDKVVSVEEMKQMWRANEKLEFIFSRKGIADDVVESIISGDYAKAIDALLKCEESANVWNLLGVTYGYSGEYDKARHYFERADSDISSVNINELNKKIIKINI